MANHLAALHHRGRGHSRAARAPLPIAMPLGVALTTTLTTTLTVTITAAAAAALLLAVERALGFAAAVARDGVLVPVVRRPRGGLGACPSGAAPALDELVAVRRRPLHPAAEVEARARARRVEPARRVVGK